jgi:hypothetical protein
LSLIAGSSALFGVGSYVYSYFVRQRHRSRVQDNQKIPFISDVIENVMTIRRQLKTNIKNKTHFPNPWKGEKGEFFTQKALQDYLKELEVQDYVILDDFYTKLDEREQKLSNTISEQELRELNKHLLELADKALLSIDWKKYTPR